MDRAEFQLKSRRCLREVLTILLVGVRRLDPVQMAETAARVIYSGMEGLGA